MTTPLDVLGRADYVLLTTFRQGRHRRSRRRSGSCGVGDELRVWTIRDAGKVKRIRRSGRVQVAPCTLRGEPRGESVDATARMLPDSEAPVVLNALAAKYGLLGWLRPGAMSRLHPAAGRVIGITVP